MIHMPEKKTLSKCPVSLDKEGGRQEFLQLLGGKKGS